MSGPESSPSPFALVLSMLGLVIVGSPLVYVLWGAVNHALLGEFGEIDFVLFVPAAFLFAGLAIFVSRVVRSWEAS